MTGGSGGGRDERLHRIDTVTDAALSHLDVEGLLSELLERVRELLDVDTAAVLLLDPHSQQLVATAAKGLEDEVRLGFRIPVGVGFAGRVAKDRQPVVIENVRAGDVVNPILREKGIVSLLGVPMLADGQVIGVLHVATLRPRRFTDDDIKLLQLVADRAAWASQARLNSIDRAAALALQHSLLPTRLPLLAGIDLAARYVPGHDAGVGGDWYDVFVLPSGWLGLVIGDVTGHGLAAAVVMGRLRSALRAYALESDDPADVLTRLDRKVHHFEAGNMATVLYAMISPQGDQAQISLAGHLPPVLAARDRPTAPMRLPVDTPLGTRIPHVRRSTTVALPTEAIMVCYTDGLVERRGEIIDTGLGRLCTAVEPGTAEEICARVMSACAPERATDDIALLTLRRHDDDA